MTATPAEAVVDIQLLLDAAQESGHVALGTLSLAEQFALGGQGWAVTEAAAVRRWAEMTPEERHQGEVAALAGLLERGVLSVGDEGAPVFAPWLAIVAKSRTEPAFLLVPGPGTFRPPGGTIPYGYAVLADDLGFAGFVVELRSEVRSEFRFVAPEQMAAGLANWLIATAASEVSAEGKRPVSLQIIGPGNQALLTVGTLSVRAVTTGKVALSDGETETKEMDVGELACYLMDTFLSEAIVLTISVDGARGDV